MSRARRKRKVINRDKMHHVLQYKESDYPRKSPHAQQHKESDEIRQSALHSLTV